MTPGFLQLHVPKVLTLAVACALLRPDIAIGAELYVCHAGGDDRRVKAEAQNERTPWATIGRAAWGSADRGAPNAAQAAVAGDVVIVCAGTYVTAGTGLRYEPAYNPVNSGTSDRPITFEARGTVRLTLNSSRGPVIGAYRRDYIRWRGFTIDEREAPSRGDTGPVVLWQTTGSHVEDCTIIGDDRPEVLVPDNHPGIRAELTERCVIRNNRISRFRNKTPGNNPINAACIQTYATDGITIEHNDISECGSGIFLKHNYGTGVPWTFSPDEGNRVRFNLIHSVGTGIAVHVNPTPPGQSNLVHQNIVRNVTTALHIRTFGRPTHEPRRVRFVNNTIDNTTNAGLYVNAGANFVDDAGHALWNNILTNSGQYVIWSELRDDGNFGDRAKFSSEHNVFRSFRQFALVHDDHTLSDWQRRFSQDSASPKSITSDPQYVDAAAGDFRLKPGSPARTQGRAVDGIGGQDGTTIPAGAYITGDERIGVLSGTPARRSSGAAR